MLALQEMSFDPNNYGLSRSVSDGMSAAIRLADRAVTQFSGSSSNDLGVIVGSLRAVPITTECGMWHVAMWHAYLRHLNSYIGDCRTVSDSAIIVQSSVVTSAFKMPRNNCNVAHCISGL